MNTLRSTTAFDDDGLAPDLSLEEEEEEDDGVAVLLLGIFVGEGVSSGAGLGTEAGVGS